MVPGEREEMRIIIYNYKIKKKKLLSIIFFLYLKTYIVDFIILHTSSLQPASLLESIIVYTITIIITPLYTY